MPHNPTFLWAILLALLAALALAAALGARLRAARRASMAMLRTLTSAIDAADPLTWGHSYRISRMCLAIARRLGLRGRELHDLEAASLLHEIGRTAIRHEVIDKPGRLSAEEKAEVRTHTVVGRDIALRVGLSPAAAETIHAHHERPDGAGYPRGLAGEAIPRASRVIMAVAAFDALTSDRPYRRGLEPMAAIEELLGQAQTQFFPDVVEALVELYATGGLFEDFEEEYLAACAAGQGSSRAVEEFLARRKADAEAREAEAAASAASALAVVAEPAPPTEVSSSVPLGGKWKLAVAGLSDPGCRRTNNEDAFSLVEWPGAGKGCALVLADGMGGMAAGEVASRIAVEAVKSEFSRAPRSAGASTTVERAVQSANAGILARAGVDARLRGMGTTCTLAALSGRDLVLGHVGDSRAYLVRAGSIEQLSQDHTVRAELVSMGGRAGGHASAALTRCLGNQTELVVDVGEPLRLEDGASIVLCSDGLSNMVDGSEILDVVSQETPEEACRTLVELARERGGPDNITVVVGRVMRG